MLLTLLYYSERNVILFSKETKMSKNCLLFNNQKEKFI